MSQVYINGKFVDRADATLSVFDRGFLFADAVYEVTAVIDGKILDFQEHMARLMRSLSALGIRPPRTADQLLEIHRELIVRNGLKEGIVYLQISRGVSERDFYFCESGIEPAVVLFTQEKRLLLQEKSLKGQSVITAEDLRWGRCDIKTVQLLYPSMMKTFAKRNNVDDVWLTRENLVTEGTSSNAFIVGKDNVIVTRNLSSSILAGITRASVFECAEKLNLGVEERPFSVDEVENAREAFSTSAPTFVNPVVRINAKPVGDGLIGEITAQLRHICIEKSLATRI